MLVASIISSFTSIGGLSGAFILLPFQISVLGFTGPAVSPTNLLFNVVAIPSGVYRYVREKRMVWHITWAVIIGTVPGVFIGAFIRIRFLPDPRTFKLFVACVLGYIGYRLIRDILRKNPNKFGKFNGEFVVKNSSLTLKHVSFDFLGKKYHASTMVLFLVSFVVGIIGGTYGIGGGAIIAPFLVTVLKLPVHTIAGASLMGTLVTSIVGVIFYTWLGMSGASAGMNVQPDWILGLLFGIGGSIGMYLGARTQKFLPEKFIKAVIAMAILIVVVKYVVEFFSRVP